MSFKDLLLLGGTLPLWVVVAQRLAAEAGLRHTLPPPEALPAALLVLGLAFGAYVVLELRSIARDLRRLARGVAELGAAVKQQPARRARVSNFAIHLDRALEVDLREAAGADDQEQEASDAHRDTDDELRGNGARPSAPRPQVFGEVQSLLAQIPSVRQSGASGRGQ
jgi:hypothetical protein